MSDKEKKLKYNNLREFLDYARNNLKKINIPKAGELIYMNYFFYLNSLYKLHPEKKKYLDFFPCDLVLAVQPQKHTMICVNFHALPVITRQILIARLKKDYPNPFDDKPRIRIPGMSYRKILKYLKRIGVSIRKYRFERIKDLRVISSDQIDTILKFYPQTYYQSTYNKIVSNYNNFKPKPQ